MHTPECINILCATDDNYVPYCGIMLTSVFENNKDVVVNAYVLIDTPLSKKDQHKMEQLANKYGQMIHFVEVDNTTLLRYPTKGMSYWSIATYYRLFATELLPLEIDKILYLDCDIVVTGSLKELYQMDITDKAVAAAEDLFTCFDTRQKNLGYPKEAGYFNAGVLLMNLECWRKYTIGKQCLRYLEDNYSKLEAYDQDILNAVLLDKKMRIPLVFNYQLQFLLKRFYYLQTDAMQQEISNTYANPIVIHYAYHIKPWSIMYYQMPFHNEWKYYKSISPWSHIFPSLPKRKTINNIIKRFIMWPLGLMHYDSGFITINLQKR